MKMGVKMSDLRKKRGFKVIVCIIIQLFILNNICFAGALDEEKYKQKKTLSQDCPGEEIELAQANPVVTGYSGLSNQGYSAANTTEEKTDFGGVADALTDCDLSTKCSILQSAGANEAETAIALLGNGHKAEEVSSALIEAGYDAQKVNTFLGNTIKQEQNTAKNKKETVQIEAATHSSIEPQEQSSESIDVDTVQTNQQNASAAVSEVSQDISYQSLLDLGLTDAEIVAQLKAEGFSATDILKAATDLDRDMVGVANAMQEAGFSNADIVTAFITKAMDWTVDTTIDIVNCAVQSLAEILTGQGNVLSAIGLAYEVIVADIMQTGGVNIQDGQIMSSMNAIKDVAADHGVNLQGYNLTISDLEQLQGQAIVHLNGNHWAVVTDITGDTVTLMDNGTEVTMSKAEFISQWDGNTLISSKEKVNKTALTKQNMTAITGAGFFKRLKKKIKKTLRRMKDKYGSLSGMHILHGSSFFGMIAGVVALTAAVTCCFAFGLAAGASGLAISGYGLVDGSGAALLGAGSGLVSAFPGILTKN